MCSESALKEATGQFITYQQRTQGVLPASMNALSLDAGPRNRVWVY